MIEKLILTDNEAIWLIKIKDTVSLYENINDDSPNQYILSRENKLKIIKFLLDTL